MREGITIEMSDADRTRLAAIVADRNSPQKHVWRAQIVLLTADGVGTNAIMRRTGKSKVTIWRWQERFMTEGIAGAAARQDAPVVHSAAADGGARPHSGPDPDSAAGRGDPLDGRDDGQSARHQRQLGAAHLARARPPTASGAPVQAVLRSAVRRQAARCCRSLCRSASACGRLVGRREVANPSA